VKVETMKQLLLDEGCNPIDFSTGPGGSDMFCLDNQNGTRRVLYTERGRDHDPSFESANKEGRVPSTSSTLPNRCAPIIGWGSSNRGRMHRRWRKNPPKTESKPTRTKSPTAGGRIRVFGSL